MAPSLRVALAVCAAVFAVGVHSASPAGSMNTAAVTIAIPEGLGPDNCPNALVCDPFWSGLVERPVIRGAFLIRPDYSYEPDLIRKVVVSIRPVRIVYYIKQRAVWSDGVPVTAADWRFTWRANRGLKWADHAGYADISSIRGNGKRVVVSFKRPYADWKSLFDYVLPAHALSGAVTGTAWTAGIIDPKSGQPIGDGPYLLTEYGNGKAVLQRNKRWWGQKPHFQTIVVRAVPEVRDAVLLLRSHEVDAYYSRNPNGINGSFHGPYVGLRLQSTQSSVRERLDIEQGLHRQPLARNSWLRQAVAFAVDRRAVAHAVFDSFGFLGVRPLNNVVYLRNQRNYVAHWAKWKPNPGKAEAILRAHGCARGEDGIYACRGTKLTFDVDSSSIQGMPKAFDAIRAQLAAVGMDVHVQFISHGASFPAVSALELVRDDRPDPSAFATRQWQCGASHLTLTVCDRKVDRLLKSSIRTLDPRRSSQLRNRADVLLANDLWTLPLYQLPTTLVYESALRGVHDNPATGPLWNVEDWQFGNARKGV